MKLKDYFEKIGAANLRCMALLNTGDEWLDFRVSIIGAVGGQNADEPGNILEIEASMVWRLTWTTL